ncbi:MULTISPECIES: glycosyl hydrolase family 28-related protein [Desulfococcus]|uniref:Putative virulence factor (Pectin lyase fold protein) n=1 Tax=Desulfococcus multivorans DSM 2059 TaxID=1121405 RepID=S7TW91_DESML|nr:glycosyl hydrolase family 28-related protein [Desulfococcus multivorans]AOY58142.1 putative virulence factor, pectin lyase fold protein [Desulfococcus multivorans]AQV00496.1 virulence factor [Desulfococcus multivorans]EPR41291.1 putative virulence factor (pectin lyase fold protein) [Desulfococcus multivorans DSM 2059]MDX9819204.1 glycosyl hydrolase family 28-related protein [Desulfococcus multivorans]SJZ73756.1 Pectate lyase superfamily protein [Desulfococcus multivorans DSM 2059]
MTSPRLTVQKPCAIIVFLIVVMAGSLSGSDPAPEDSTSGKPVMDKAAGHAWIPADWTAYQRIGASGSGLPDFSRAGYAMGDRPIPHVSGPVFDVTEQRFGAVPGDDRDDTAAIQAAIDTAGAAGGGVVFLPRGRFDIRQTGNAPYLRITRDQVVLRGQGDGTDGTVLFLGSPGPAGTVRRLGSVPALKEPRSGAAVAVIGPENREFLARYISDLRRGERQVAVSDTSRLSVGQSVVVEFEDPLIDTRNPHPKKADLPVQLTHPFRLTADQTDTFGKTARRLTWIVRIAQIVDAHTVRLTNPARFDQWLRYQPRIYAFRGVSGVGIENLRIESRWPGNYRHHKPHVGTDGAVIRTAREQDYLWNGLWMSYALDGWVRNVTFKDLTQGIIISHSTNLSVQDVRFDGLDAHAGITIGRSNDVLVSGADFFARMVHPVTLTMMASGNVVTDCEIHYDGRDDETATDAVIDFHGIFPFENLFDCLRGFYVCPGGDMSVLPHAGVRNVFWNIEAPRQMRCYGQNTDGEFVCTYAYQGTSSGTPRTMHEHLPQAFFIGIRRSGGNPITIGGSILDRKNEWLSVEGLNRPGIAIPSLYEAQRAGFSRERREMDPVSEARRN